MPPIQPEISPRSHKNNKKTSIRPKISLNTVKTYGYITKTYGHTAQNATKTPTTAEMQLRSHKGISRTADIINFFFPPKEMLPIYFIIFPIIIIKYK
jgi:hypothetical protein